MKNETKHTPGPWHAAINVRGFDSQVVGSNGLICEVYGRGNPRNFGSTENARLIAAAPDLLDALQRCEELLSSITDIRSDLAEFQDGYLRQARTAIANARGLK